MYAEVWQTVLVLPRTVRPYQFDFMFLRSLPETLDTAGREKKEKKSMNLIKIRMNLIKNDQSPQSFVLAYMNMGTSYLESILGSKEAKEHSLAHCTTCLACKTLQSYTNPGSHFFFFFFGK